MLIQSNRARALYMSMMFFSYAIGRSAGAAPIPQLQEFLQNQLEHVPQAVASCSLSDSPEALEAEYWDFHTFFLDVNPYISFGIPGVAEVQISPEIGFVWEKEE
jgi:hypothetical protein